MPEYQFLLTWRVYVVSSYAQRESVAGLQACKKIIGAAFKEYLLGTLTDNLHTMACAVHICSDATDNVAGTEGQVRWTSNVRVRPQKPLPTAMLM